VADRRRTGRIGAAERRHARRTRTAAGTGSRRSESISAAAAATSRAPTQASPSSWRRACAAAPRVAPERRSTAPSSCSERSCARAVAADYFGFTLDVEATNLRPAVELLSDVVLHPTFPVDGIEGERALQLAAIKRSFDSSIQRPFALAAGQLFPAHPYGQTATGTAASVSRLDRDALAAWWRRQIAAEDAALFVVGDVAADDARRLVEEVFAGLPIRGASRAVVPAPTLMPARTELVEFRDRRQSAIVLGFPAVAAGHVDAPALALLQKATSGLAGTFFAELRGRRSLAYTVFVSPSLLRDGGVLYAYLASEAKKEDEAKAALLAEVWRLSEDGLSETDLARAKSSYAGETRIDLQTNGAILADYAQNLFLGLGLDGTEKRLAAASKMTLDEVRQVAKRYLASDLFTTAVLRGKS
jgi:zinc protease